MKIICVIVLIIIAALVLSYFWLTRDTSIKTTLTPYSQSSLNGIIVFDFDGTLCDNFDLAVEVLEELSPQYGLPNFNDREKTLIRRLGTKAYLQGKNIGTLNTLKLVQDARDRIGTKMPRAKLFNGLGAELKKLQSEGYLLVIMTTNSEENVVAFLERFGMQDTFNLLVTQVGLLNKKKVLKNFVNEYLNNKTTFVVMIGDEARDIEAATYANIPSIAVSWGYQNREGLQKSNPTVTIDKVDSLAEAIQNLHK